MKKEPKYQRITGLRALDLLQRIREVRINDELPNNLKWDLISAFENHVKSELTRKNRRRARKVSSGT